MNYVKLGSTFRVMFGTTSGDGAAVNADALPVVTVRDQGTAMGYAPVVTNKATGLYEVALVMTGGNGFTAGHEYTAEVAATVGTIVGRDGIASFKLTTYDVDDLAAALIVVQADTDDIQTRLPAALVSGRIDASVGAVAANAITAAAIATDAIDADAIAATAVTELQSGLATAASVAALPSAATIATAVWAYVVENATTAVEYYRLAIAVLFGKASGLDTGTPTFRDQADTKNRVVSAVAGSNRTFTTRDGT